MKSFGGYLTYRANRLAGIARQFPAAAIRAALAGAEPLACFRRKNQL